MTIELDEGSVPRTGGPALYFVSAMPSAPPKAMLAIIPGYADHAARYGHVMGALAEHGIGSVAVDLRGHGRAQGTRGYCSRFDEFLDDVRELRILVDRHAAQTPGGAAAPRFLFGHSFGGLVAATSALADPSPWKGLVLSAPYLGLALEVPALKIAAAKVMSRIYPKLGLPSGLHGADMTHDAERAKAYDGDPLVFPNATARWFTESSAAQERALAGASRLKLPLYEVFGTADKVASMRAGKRFFDAASSASKVWDEREGLFHEVLNEAAWKDIVESIAKWVLAQASAQ
ncbi:MAG: Lysophospholipase [Labilithrix sp.]|nr:Lysophospholipase [Labilithrix sp.]